MQRYAKRTRQMVIAGACRAQTARRVWHKPWATTGKDAELLEESSDIRALQAVVAMFALDVHLDQVFGLEPAQMDAGSGRADAGDDGKLGAGSGMIVHERIKHAGSSGLADGSGHARNSAVVTVIVDIHTLMIYEVSLRDKRWERKEDLALTSINGSPHPLTLLARLPWLFGHHSAAEIASAKHMYRDRLSVLLALLV